MNIKNCLFCLTAIFLLTSCNKSSTESSATDLELKDEIDQVSYALGMNISQGLMKQEVEINRDVFYQALNTGFDKGEFKYTEEDAFKVLNEFSNKIKIKLEAKRQKDLQAVKEESAAFHEKNKSEDGIVSLPSGLQYKVINAADGAKPKSDSAIVVVNYEGRLIDGSVFDSSYTRGEPAEFALNQVIKGWTEGIQLMNVGSTWEFYIPAELAYGSNPPPGSIIKPNSSLIFKVDLLEVK